MSRRIRTAAATLAVALTAALIPVSTASAAPALPLLAGSAHHDAPRHRPRQVLTPATQPVAVVAFPSRAVAASV